MAKYKLTAQAVLDGVLRQPGYEFEYEGVPGPHMEPVDAAAKKAVEDRDKAAEGQPAPIGSPVGGYVHVEPPPLTPPAAATKEETKEEPKAEPKAEPKEEPYRTIPRDHDTTGGGRRG